MAEKEYIEREAAIKAVKKERNYTGKFSFEEEHAWAVGFQQGITFALSDISAIPAADVRPVVTCSDCKWWTKQEASLQGRCELLQMYPTGAWFCANGKREES